ncbi:MAG: CoA transferase, partial [Hyphomicrobiaceae bacterium]
ELADDPRFGSNGDRVTNRAALSAVLAERLAAVDGESFSLKLLAAGLPCGPILNARQALDQPHTSHRGMVQEMGWYKGTGTPIKFARTPGKVKAPPPRFSEHAREVLAEHGFSEADIARLAATGIVVEKRRV